MEGKGCKDFNREWLAAKKARALSRIQRSGTPGGNAINAAWIIARANGTLSDYVPKQPKHAGTPGGNALNRDWIIARANGTLGTYVSKRPDSARHKEVKLKVLEKIRTTGNYYYHYGHPGGTLVSATPKGRKLTLEEFKNGIRT